MASLLKRWLALLLLSRFLINGTDPGIAQAINKAVDAGIPTVVYDSDIPNSKRHAFLRTDWHEIGVMHGEEMARLIGGKGKVTYMGILGLTNMEQSIQAYWMFLKIILIFRSLVDTMRYGLIGWILLISTIGYR